MTENDRNVFHGAQDCPVAANPEKCALHYLFQDGKVFYRVRDIHLLLTGEAKGVGRRDLPKGEGVEVTTYKDSLSQRPSLYVTYEGAQYVVERVRFVPVQQRMAVYQWFAETQKALAPKAATWEPELPKEEPPELHSTEDLPPQEAQAEAESPEIWQVQEENAQLLEEVDRLRRERDSIFASAAKRLEEADKQKKAAKEPEKDKGHCCTCQNKPFVPAITSGQVAAATQMVEVWKAAGIDNKMIAMALNGFFPNLSLPVGAFTESDTEYYSASAIAAYVGVYSKKGNPHGGAVAAVIKRFIQPKDEDICKLPFTQNGHSGVCTQYSAAVLAQVEDWFDKEQYPESLSVEGKTYQLCYDAM